MKNLWYVSVASASTAAAPRRMHESVLTRTGPRARCSRRPSCRAGCSGSVASGHLGGASAGTAGPAGEGRARATRTWPARAARAGRPARAATSTATPRRRRRPTSSTSASRSGSPRPAAARRWIRRRSGTSRPAPTRRASTSTSCRGRRRTSSFTATEATKEAGIAPSLDIAEYGPKGPWWYDVLTVRCAGPGGKCNRDAADAWSAEAKSRKRGRVDPCGSAVISHLVWDTSGGTGNRELGLFKDFTVRFTHGGETLPDAVASRTRRSACPSEGSSDRDLRDGHGVAGGAAQGRGPRRARLRRARLPADVRRSWRSRRSQCFEGFRPANLDWGPDAVVVGNVCRKDHVEVLAAQERGIPLESFPSLFGKLFLRRGSAARSVVVAGTHGKTTTSSLLAHVLTDAGARSVVPDRRRAAELPPVLAPRRGRRVRHRGRRVRHRVLRQGIEVPALPARRSCC